MNANQARAKSPRATGLAATLFVVCAFVAPCLAGTGGLDDAVSLYQEARYGEALQMLDGLGADSAVPPADAADRQRIAEYRALCLMALDREDEARAVVQKLLEARPDYHPSAGDFPPRFLAAVSSVRTEMVPALARAEYRRGKASYDEKAYPEAQLHMRLVLTLVDDKDVAATVRASLGDLRDLANGFLALIPARMDGPDSIPPLPAGAPRAPAVALTAAATPAAFYTTADADVVPPVTVQQEFPPWRVGTEDAFMPRGSEGLLELIIDERGQVASARLASPMNRLYDERLLSAARRWQYRPATKDGQPVRFRKLIEVRAGDAAKEPPSE